MCNIREAGFCYHFLVYRFIDRLEALQADFSTGQFPGIMFLGILFLAFLVEFCLAFLAVSDVSGCFWPFLMFLAVSNVSVLFDDFRDM